MKSIKGIATKFHERGLPEINLSCSELTLQQRQDLLMEALEIINQNLIELHGAIIMWS